MLYSEGVRRTLYRIIASLLCCFYKFTTISFLECIKNVITRARQWGILEIGRLSRDPRAVYLCIFQVVQAIFLSTVLIVKLENGA